MIYAFFVSLLGFAFGIRISHHFIERELLSRSELTKIGTVHALVFATLVALAPRTLFALWGAVFTPICLSSLALLAIVTKRSREFKDRFRETLTLILLKMKSGKSFRQSLGESVDECGHVHRAKLAELANVVAFSQQKQLADLDDLFIREMTEELIRVDRSPHSAIRRLTVLRDRLRIESDFRHRSGQVLAQIRAQSLIMSGLYVAVLVFAINRFGWRNNSDIMMASIALFAIGAAWIWYGGRRMQWKV